MRGERFENAVIALVRLAEKENLESKLARQVGFVSKREVYCYAV
jgi:hypothetical protein